MQSPSPPFRYLAVSLLVLQAVWLSWSAYHQAPTLNEPGHLASGLAHLQFGRFEPFRVNPPLTRLIAALPVAAAGCKTDWKAFTDKPGTRCEFALGADFVKANGRRSQHLLWLSRLACIPFSLVGAWLCYKWALTLYGPTSAMLALALWVVEPTLIAHGQLITPDAAATAAGLASSYTLWRWLRAPSWATSVWAGLGLGFALSTKFTWVFLLVLWPVLAFALRRHAASGNAANATPWPIWLSQLLAIESIALCCVGAAYGFDGMFEKLGDYRFASHAMSGRESGALGNRFSDTALGSVPMPIPRQWLLGIDIQTKDLERYSHQSFLAGEWRSGGWWYYYLYAAAVKVPLGLWVAVLVALFIRARDVSSRRVGTTSAELVLILPAAVLFIAVSSQLAFNHHFRYVLPCFGPAIVAVSSILRTPARPLTRLSIACVLVIAIPSVAVAPHSLSYFNVFAGGPAGGHEHLLHSSYDWGQDLLNVQQWAEEHPASRPLFLAYYGSFDPADLGVTASVAPFGPSWGTSGAAYRFEKGWYAVSVNFLHGCEWRLSHRWAYVPFLKMREAGSCGHSIRVYYLDDAGAEQMNVHAHAASERAHRNNSGKSGVGRGLLR